ncbi:hypothetical protein ACOMHN_061964 [Nucella lapillus]
MPSNTHTIIGGTKRLECRVIGHPRPEIRWFKDGRDITHSERYSFDHTYEGVISMILENISHKDEGHYRCRAENTEGIASTSAYLLVKAHKEHPDEEIDEVHSMELEEHIVYKSNKDHTIMTEFARVSSKTELEAAQRRTFEQIVDEEKENVREILNGTVSKDFSSKKSSESSTIIESVTEQSYGKKVLGKYEEESSSKRSLIISEENTSLAFHSEIESMESSGTRQSKEKGLSVLTSMEETKVKADLAEKEMIMKVSVDTEESSSSQSKSGRLTVSIDSEINEKSKERGLSVEVSGVETSSSTTQKSSNELVTSVSTEETSTESSRKGEEKERRLRVEVEVEEVADECRMEIEGQEEEEDLTKSVRDSAPTSLCNDSGFMESSVMDSTQLHADSALDSALESSTLDSVESETDSSKTKPVKREISVEESRVQESIASETSDITSLEEQSEVLKSDDVSVVTSTTTDTRKTSLVEEIRKKDVGETTTETTVSRWEEVKAAEEVIRRESTTVSQEMSSVSQEMSSVSQEMSHAEETVENISGGDITGLLDEIPDPTTVVEEVEVVEEAPEGQGEPRARWVDQVTSKTETLAMEGEGRKVEDLTSEEEAAVATQTQVEQANLSRTTSETAPETSVDADSLTARQTSVVEDLSTDLEQVATVDTEVSSKDRRRGFEERLEVDEELSTRNVLGLEKAPKSTLDEQGSSVDSFSQAGQETKAADMDDGLTVKAEVSTEESVSKAADMDDGLTVKAEVSTEESLSQEDEELRISAEVSVSESEARAAEKGERGAPRMVSVPEDVSVQLGQTIHLVSQVQGDPQPEVKWFKEGDSVKSGSRVTLQTDDDDVFTLEIHEASEGDGGTYTLTAHNALGTIFSDALVTVTLPHVPGAPDEDITLRARVSVPEFVTQPGKVTVKDLGTLELVCTIREVSVCVWGGVKVTVKDLGTLELVCTIRGQSVCVWGGVKVTVKDLGTLELVCTIRGQCVWGGGGKVTVKDLGTLELVCTIRGGGGVKVTVKDLGTLELVCTIRGQCVWGGGVKVTVKDLGSTLELVCTIREVSLCVCGGGVKVTVKDLGTLELVCTIRGQSVCVWGGVKVTVKDLGTLELVCTIREVSGCGGGGVKVTVKDLGTLELVCTIREVSVCVCGGGGVKVTVKDLGTLELVCTIRGQCVCVWGGGVKVTVKDLGTLELVCTIRGQCVCVWGGGVKVTVKDLGTLELVCTIRGQWVWGGGQSDGEGPGHSGTGLYHQRSVGVGGGQSDGEGPGHSGTGLYHQRSVCVCGGGGVKVTVKDLGTLELVCTIRGQCVGVCGGGGVKVTVKDLGTLELVCTIRGQWVCGGGGKVTVKDLGTLELVCTIRGQWVCGGGGKVTVKDLGTLELVCTIRGTPSPTVEWTKEGQTLQADSHRSVFESEGQYYLTIPRVTAEDAGDYTCTASNSEGAVTCTIAVFVESSGSSVSEDGASAMVPLSQRESSSDDLFLRAYEVTRAYQDEETKVALVVGEVVEVLDSRQKTCMWLVRSQTQRDQVCFIPSSHLKEKGETETDSPGKKKEGKRSPTSRMSSCEPADWADTSEDEDRIRAREKYPDYLVIADFSPPQGKGEAGLSDWLKVTEGQVVEVVDMERADRWLVQTRPTKTCPARQGWVPASYLEPKAGAPLLHHRSTREVFREDVLQIANKQHEAALKRRYAITELVESEREYVRDLQKLLDSYYPRLGRRATPSELKEKRDLIFSNINDILDFHKDVFLKILETSVVNPGTIGDAFLVKERKFNMYVSYMVDHLSTKVFVETEEAQEFLREYSRSIGDSELTLPRLLECPILRLDSYQTLLKDVLRYTARMGEDCGSLERAVAMLASLQLRVRHTQLLQHVEGLTEDVSTLGQLVRHEDVITWDSDVNNARAKERHLFLFKDKVVVTKKKKGDSPTDQPTFAFKATVELQNVQLNENVKEDERRFEVWYTSAESEKLTVQTKTLAAKQAWLKDTRELLKALGVEETDIMPEKTEETSTQPTPVPVQKKKPADKPTSLPLHSESESDRTLTDGDYASLSSFDDSDISSYHTAPEFEDGTTRPVFKKRPKKTVCQEGNTARFDCIVGGSPLPSVRWLKDGAAVRESDQVQVSSEGDASSLTLLSVVSGQAGQYTALAANLNGSILSAADLVVLEELGLEKAEPSQEQETNGAVEDEEKTPTEEAPSTPLPQPRPPAEEEQVTKDPKAAPQPEESEETATEELSESEPSKAEEEEPKAETAESSEPAEEKEPAVEEEVKQEAPEAEEPKAEPPEDQTDSQPPEEERTVEPEPESKPSEPVVEDKKRTVEEEPVAPETQPAKEESPVEAEPAPVVEEKNAAVGEEAVVPDSKTVEEDKLVEAGPAPVVEEKKPREEEQLVSEAEQEAEEKPRETQEDRKPPVEETVVPEVKKEEELLVEPEPEPVVEEKKPAVEEPVELEPKKVEEEKPVEEPEPKKEDEEKPVEPEPAPVAEDKKPTAEEPVEPETEAVEEKQRDKPEPGVEEKKPAAEEDVVAEVEKAEGELPVEPSPAAEEKEAVAEEAAEAEVKKVEEESAVVQEPAPVAEQKEPAAEEKPAVPEKKTLEEEKPAEPEPEPVVEDKKPVVEEPVAPETEKVEELKLAEPEKKPVAPETEKVEELKLAEPQKKPVVEEPVAPEAEKVEELKPADPEKKAAVEEAALPVSKKVEEAALPVSKKVEEAALPVSRKVEEAALPVSRKVEEAALPVSRKVEEAALPVSKKVEEAALPVSRKVEEAALPVSRKAEEEELVTKDKEEDRATKAEEAEEEEESRFKPIPDTAEEEIPVRAPHCLSEMNDVVVELGQLARFDCRVAAYPDPEITWLKDGHKVVPTERYLLQNFHDDIFSLLIKKVKKEDSGCYTCLARNEYGEAKTEALLNVRALVDELDSGDMAPAFATKFGNVECVESVPVEFTCQIKGRPPPSITWLLNGRELTPSLDILMRQQEDSIMLAFRSVQVDHSGDVVCKLKNHLGEATCRAKLLVREDLSKKGDVPLFEERPCDLEVTEGGEAMFECVITGFPEPEVLWFFNGRELFDSRRRVIQKKGDKYQLILKEVIADNAGVYTCKAINAAGDASCAVELAVKEIPKESRRRMAGAEEVEYSFPPTFTRRLLDQRVSPGRTARFECLMLGIPLPDVQWQKDGKPVQPSDKLRMGREGTTAILEIDNAEVEDGGEYTCILTNATGKASSRAGLTVQGELQIYWGGGGEYTCILTNATGKASSRAGLTVQEERRPSYATPKLDARVPATMRAPSRGRESMEPPRLTRELTPEDKVPSLPFDKPHLLDLRDESVKLSWLPARTSNLPENARHVTYTVEARELPSNRWTRLASGLESTHHVAKSLRPDREYMFRVLAENKFGPSDHTLPATLAPRHEPEEKKRLYGHDVSPAPVHFPSTRPFVMDIGPETLRLGWHPADRAATLPPVSYRVEAQKLPSEEWIPLASRVQATSLYLSDLEPDRDYNVRVRAQGPYGVTPPTAAMWLPRAAAFTGVPVSRPQITELEPDTVRLHWERVDVPSFSHEQEPLTYMIEMQEPPATHWREIAAHVPHTHYTVRDLDPGTDYRFRVRAQSVEGLRSEPSPVTSIYRTLALSHAPIDRVEVTDYEPEHETVGLSWRRVEIPPFDSEDEPLMYMIECQEPQSDSWRPLVSGIPTTRYRVPDISPTADYRFRVRALTPYGVSPPSPAAGLYRSPTPSRPLASDLSISSLEPESMRLSWKPMSTPASRATTPAYQPLSYQVEAREYPSTQWRPLASDVRDTSYQLTGLTPTRDYSFRVRALTPGGEMTEPTSPVTVTSLPVRPRLPSREPTIREMGADSVHLQWPRAEVPYYMREAAPISYSVEMQEVPGYTWTPVCRGIPETSYVVKGLRADRDYRFRIRPETLSGPGEYSLPVHAYRKLSISLPRREPTMTEVGPNSVTLSWQPAEVPAGAQTLRPLTYRVEMRESPRGPWVPVVERLPTARVTVNFLNPDKDYAFRVVAVLDGVESEPTAVAYLPHRMGPPKMLREPPYISSVHPDSVLLCWRSVDIPARITDYAPVTYRIEAQEPPSLEWRPLARRIPCTHHLLAGLRPGQEYNLRVRAENDAGLSEPTPSVLLRKRSVAPTMPAHEPIISDISPGSLRLSWRPAEVPSYLMDSLPVTYAIHYQHLPDLEWVPLARRVAGTNYRVTGLSPDNNYNFRVQAENQFGSSQPSQAARMPRLAEIPAPIYCPEIEAVEPSAIRLAWKAPRLGPYKTKKPTYAVETLEPDTWTWRPLVSNLTTPSYRASTLSPSLDYVFRVRAEADTVQSEPSFPISYSRTRAPPSVPVERPILSEIEPDSVLVSWHPLQYPSLGRGEASKRYKLEMRELPYGAWTPVLGQTPKWSHEVTGLRPNMDYAFRVSAVTDAGTSEPSNAAYLYRRPVIPRMPLEFPELADVSDDAVSLHWKRVNIPAYEAEDEPLSFLIEAQRLPSYDWEPVARGITDTSYRIGGLQPRQDYAFRVRGEMPSGLTTPSASIPLYRRPERTGVPIRYVTVDDHNVAPYSARVRWKPVYLPSYRAPGSTLYNVEFRETPQRDWQTAGRDVRATEFTVPDLSPRKTYMFRVRAKSPAGDLSDPSMSVPFYPLHLRAYEGQPGRELVPYNEDYSLPNRPYINTLIVKVPPRMHIEKPGMFITNPSTVHLTWNTARVPASTSQMSPTTYRVEVREDGTFNWMERASDITGLGCDISGLNPQLDYAFRVRAVNDFGWSEATLPVFLHRPISLNYEEPDIDWEEISPAVPPLVPPRLPIDSPRITPVSGDSLRLSWHPARTPAYARKAPISYVVEMKDPLASTWNPVASKLDDTVYQVRGLEPERPYLFRVRAESEFGSSEPTLPVEHNRPKSTAPRTRSQSVERQSLADYDLSARRGSYIDSITTGVPPRVPAGRPSLTNATETGVTLSWPAPRLPAYMKNTRLDYVVEYRETSSRLWASLAERVPDTSYKVTGLDPEQDYMFRVRAHNDAGTSEPTLPATLERPKKKAATPQRRGSSVERRSLDRRSMDRMGSERRSMSRQSLDRRSESRASRRGEGGRKDGKDVDTLPGMSPEDSPQAPEFSSVADEAVQYGVESNPMTLSLQLRGHPPPQVTWYHQGQKLELGDRYDTYVTPTGQVFLEFLNMSWDDVGDYRCVAENELGTAEKTVKIVVADPPTFIEPLHDVTVVERGQGTLSCRVDGIPYPSVRFMKDWRPLTDTSRLVVTSDPDQADRWSLAVNKTIQADSGSYMCVAENVAGKVFSTGRVSVEDQSLASQLPLYKDASLEDHYYVLQDIGRGRHGRVRRVIEKNSGKEFAAKFIQVRDTVDKDFFRSELDMLRKQNHKNIVSVHDAYETPRQLIIVTELLDGGELLDGVVREGQWSEVKAAGVIRQVLETLQHVHSHGIVHLDVKPSNLLLSGDTLDTVKLIDFGLSRKLSPSEDTVLNHGTPGFTSPEALDVKPVSTATDLWGVGVLAYILLGGQSPFQADSVADTLKKTQACDWSFDVCKPFSSISQDAKDFIAKILQKNPEERPTVDECLSHPWLKKTEGGASIDITPIKDFQDRDKKQRQATAARTMAYLRTLQRQLTGGEVSERGLRPTVDPQTGSVSFPDIEAYGEFLDSESWYEWQSRYGQGPDSGLLPLKDPEYTARIRGYKRSVGAFSQMGLPFEDDDAMSPAEREKYKMMKERRRMAEIDKEEVPPSVEKELQWLEERRQARKARDPQPQRQGSVDSRRSSISTDGEGPVPVFRQRLQDLTFETGDSITMYCALEGPPPYSTVWYKNEELLSDGTRVKQELYDDGQATLTLTAAKPYDAGVYKCVARSKAGRASSRMRLLQGDVPERPGRPVVVQTAGEEVALIWEAPRNSGNCPILYYRVDHKAAGDSRWTCSVFTPLETCVVSGLKPQTSYRLRVSAANLLGRGPFSWASADITTSKQGSLSGLTTGDLTLQQLRQLQEQSREVAGRPRESEVEEEEGPADTPPPALLTTDPAKDYALGDTLWKGNFGEMKEASSKKTSKRCLVKSVPSSLPDAQREFHVLKTLRHETVLRLLSAFAAPGAVLMVLEAAPGGHVAQRLLLRRRFSEDCVACIIRQVLYGLQFLHRNSVVHLNLQPCALMVTSPHGLSIKMADFSLAHVLPSGADSVAVPRKGYPDFIAPEVVVKDKASPASDVWSVGTLTFLLLSGLSPFSGVNDEETLVNVAYCRYDAGDLLDGVSNEALRFLFKVMKRLPRNRPTVQECLEHKWLQLTDAMMKTREANLFRSNRLQQFVRSYDARRQSQDHCILFEDLRLPAALTAPAKEDVADSPTEMETDGAESKSSIDGRKGTPEEPREETVAGPDGTAADVVHVEHVKPSTDSPLSLEDKSELSVDTDQAPEEETEITSAEEIIAAVQEPASFTAKGIEESEAIRSPVADRERPAVEPAVGTAGPDATSARHMDCEVARPPTFSFAGTRFAVSEKTDQSEGTEVTSAEDVTAGGIEGEVKSHLDDRERPAVESTQDTVDVEVTAAENIDLEQTRLSEESVLSSENTQFEISTELDQSQQATEITSTEEIIAAVQEPGSFTAKGIEESEAIRSPVADRERPAVEPAVGTAGPDATSARHVDCEAARPPTFSFAGTRFAVSEKTDQSEGTEVTSAESFTAGGIESHVKSPVDDREWPAVESTQDTMDVEVTAAENIDLEQTKLSEDSVFSSENTQIEISTELDQSQQATEITSTEEIIAAVQEPASFTAKGIEESGAIKSPVADRERPAVEPAVEPAVGTAGPDATSARHMDCEAARPPTFSFAGTRFAVSEKMNQSEGTEVTSAEDVTAAVEGTESFTAGGIEGQVKSHLDDRERPAVKSTQGTVDVEVTAAENIDLEQINLSKDPVFLLGETQFEVSAELDGAQEAPETTSAEEIVAAVWNTESFAVSGAEDNEPASPMEDREQPAAESTEGGTVDGEFTAAQHMDLEQESTEGGTVDGEFTAAQHMDLEQESTEGGTVDGEFTAAQHMDLEQSKPSSDPVSTIEEAQFEVSVPMDQSDQTEVTPAQITYMDQSKQSKDTVFSSEDTQFEMFVEMDQSEEKETEITSAEKVITAVQETESSTEDGFEENKPKFYLQDSEEPAVESSEGDTVDFEFTAGEHVMDLEQSISTSESMFSHEETQFEFSLAMDHRKEEETEVTCAEEVIALVQDTGSFTADSAIPENMEATVSTSDIVTGKASADFYDWPQEAEATFQFGEHSEETVERTISEEYTVRVAETHSESFTSMEAFEQTLETEMVPTEVDERGEDGADDGEPGEDTEEPAQDGAVPEDSGAMMVDPED